MESVKTAENNNVCHDCAKKIEINGELIENGVYLNYDNNGEKINIFIFNECFAKNKALTKFQPCEVYSRVVGYIRPVQQWHKGKKQEYGERLEYKMPGEPCC
ncbi:MAG: anaerobic ribonucleoside-triphosphate reductase [Candidatus Omnitrophota bacterium]|nr:anaerobic ribonucleoside-triphosphate reductase [Candidatus Omnitrophota bacterium]